MWLEVMNEYKLRHSTGWANYRPNKRAHHSAGLSRASSEFPGRTGGARGGRAPTRSKPVAAPAVRLSSTLPHVMRKILGNS